jgi:hypothetical protein
LPDAAIARQGQPGDLVKARPLQCDAGRRARNHRFHFHREHELPGLLVVEQDRVSRRLILGHGRAGGQLQPTQPFDVHVALEAGEEQLDRVAVRGAHRLAVLVKTEERVIHNFGERNAAAHAGGIGALGDHPARGRIDAGLVKQRREFDASPFRTAEEAVNGGDAERRRLWSVERPAIARRTR